MDDLRKQVIKVAYENPGAVRDALLPLLKKGRLGIPRELRNADKLRENRREDINRGFRGWRQAANAGEFRQAVDAIRKLMLIRGILDQAELRKVAVMVEPTGFDPRKGYIQVRADAHDEFLLDKIREFLEDEWNEKARTGPHFVAWDF